MSFEPFRYNIETVYEEGTIKCKRDCFAGNDNLLFEKGKSYKVKVSGESILVYDDFGCTRPLTGKGDKPSDLMKDYFEQVQMQK